MGIIDFYEERGGTPSWGFPPGESCNSIYKDKYFSGRHQHEGRVYVTLKCVAMLGKLCSYSQLLT